ncbi:hypothetical protein DPMN_168963 [Dreissena polymorpha]|uniref:Uncharacterized protein n=1 Tax=Dreissena polymorpha TaxID=45954 RepID=A0A9D4F3P7_DREPO|nr:hypothetical protein DPMN_168963 [Dreissena polymorpha]
MQQDVTNSVCVNTIADSNAYTAQDDLHYVCGTTNTGQSYITTDDLNSVCGIAKQYMNSDTDNKNRTENHHNALCDHSNAIEEQAQMAYLNSVFLKREEIELSNVDQYYARPTVVGETIQKDLYSNLDVHRHSSCEKDDSGIFILSSSEQNVIILRFCDRLLSVVHPKLLAHRARAVVRHLSHLRKY